MAHKFLLYSGILASMLYLGTDLLAGKLLKGYSFSTHSMSDLGAAGSPVRTLVIVLTLAASALMIAFGAGVWQTVGTAVLPRIVALLIVGNAATGLIATLFFPNQFGVRPVFGSPGVLLMFLSMLCFVLAMAFGAAAFHGWMRILSIAIPAAYVLLAVLRFATAGSSAQVMVGVQERTMAYSFLVWMITLAVYLLLLTRQEVAGS
jgi:hypothetical membrane protein